MSRIKNAFQKGKAFIPFVTGGDPSIEKSEEIIMEMVRAGADLVEIGVPFSDPIAEGAVIQEANIRALSAGCTTDKIFGLVRSLRKRTEVPLVFLTYLNPVLNYGYDRFFKECENTGVDGIVIPDLPFEEKGEIKASAESCGVDIISLVAPTSENRIRKIVAEATGFLYVVSSMGVTGIRSAINTELPSILEAVKEAGDIPAAVGFGINTPEQAREISRIADGVIVGSAVVKIVAQYGEEAPEHVYAYVKSMKEALHFLP